MRSIDFKWKTNTQFSPTTRYTYMLRSLRTMSFESQYNNGYYFQSFRFTIFFYASFKMLYYLLPFFPFAYTHPHLHEQNVTNKWNFVQMRHKDFCMLLVFITVFICPPQRKGTHNVGFANLATNSSQQLLLVCRPFAKITASDMLLVLLIFIFVLLMFFIYLFIYKSSLSLQLCGGVSVLDNSWKYKIRNNIQPNI